MRWVVCAHVEGAATGGLGVGTEEEQVLADARQGRRNLLRKKGCRWYLAAFFPWAVSHWSRAHRIHTRSSIIEVCARGSSIAERILSELHAAGLFAPQESPIIHQNISQVYPELPIKYPRCFSCIITSLLDLHSMSSNVHIHMANYYNINILSSCRGAWGSPSPPDKVRENHFILTSLKTVFRPSDPDPHTGFKDKRFLKSRKD